MAASNLRRRNGIWYARIQIDGVDVRRTLNTRSRAEAERRLPTLLPKLSNASPNYRLRLDLLVDTIKASAPHGRSFIYFAQAEGGGPIKIGQSRSPSARLRKLQSHSGQPIRLLGCVRADPKIEAALHERFAAERLHHEWFKSTPRLRRLIAALVEATPAHRPAQWRRSNLANGELSD